ncbi:MAG: serine/threonine phosphatase [Cyanobacteria bacterium REEB459]|nr:serine/threonine phosphatase [Cyanobacteria bacterium REEB459]
MLNCPFCQFPIDPGQPGCPHCHQALPIWQSIAWSSDRASPLKSTGAYADPACRYHRLHQPQTTGPSGVISQLVLDCLPQAGSPLRHLQDLWLHHSDLNPQDIPAMAALPVAALPYLALQRSHFPAVPELHDVITYPPSASAGQEVILIMEDRSGWPTFLQAWAKATLDPLQQVQWLLEISLLWQALQPWQTESDLVNFDRLVVNSSHQVCLRELTGFCHQSTDLKSLGLAWQQQLQLAAGMVGSAFSLIFNHLVQGTITHIDQLQTELFCLADQMSLPASTQPQISPISPLQCQHQPRGLSPDSNLPGLSPDPDLWSGLELGLTDEQLMQIIETQAGLANQEDRDSSPAADSPTMVLPMKLTMLADAGQTHPGQRRDHNEDWFFSQTELTKLTHPGGFRLQARGIYILCDGMGGHASGEVASQLAVQTLREYFEQHWHSDVLPDQNLLFDAVARANQAIFNANQSQDNAGIGRMGTTLILVLVKDLRIAVVQVGDSRLYSYNKRQGLRQMTVDHEVGQRDIQRGIEPAIAYARPDAYHLTQALGPGELDKLEPTIFYEEILEDTVLILCSDGLSDHQVLENHSDTHLAPLLSSRHSLDQGVGELIDLANDKNGHDNITTILVRFKLRPDLEQLTF